MIVLADIMKKLLFLCLLLMVVVIGGSPYWTLYQLKNAYDSQNAEKIIAHIDIPTVKQNFKNQLNPALTQKAKNLTNLPILKALNINLDPQNMVEKIVNHSVDSTINKNNLTLLLNNSINITENTQLFAGLVAIALGKIDIQTLITARNQAELQQMFVKQLSKTNPNANQSEPTFHYCGFNCFVVHTQVHGYPIDVQLQRQNLLNWQIVAVKLPV